MTDSQSKLPAIDPTNPYLSVLITASAGSGKTYQLSRRFISLVLAGADPAKILAITFSRKAAAEMRERIIKDTILFGNHDPSFNSIYEDVSRFRNEMLQSGINVPKLRTPEDVKDLVVNRSQTLSITTIDSLLIEWSSRFSEETKLQQNNDALVMPWTIASRSQQVEQQNLAWKSAIGKLSEISKQSNGELMESLIIGSPNKKLSAAWNRLVPLISSDTFIWLSENLRNSASLFYDQANASAYDSESALLSELNNHFIKIINLVSNDQKRSSGLLAISNKSIPQLIASQILKEDWSFNGSTISKKIKNEVPDEINYCEQGLRLYRDIKLISSMNSEAKILWFLFENWRSEYFKIKVKNNTGEFSDALKGVYRLFTQNNPGARWLIENQFHHIMLDEFQDTSRLQWEVFEVLCKDILGGNSKQETALPGSVFIVGDTKQSIYSFREAAPEIMDKAQKGLESFGLNSISMSQSWRSVNSLLKVVNNVFLGNNLIVDFPEHSTALTPSKTPAIPDIGSVRVLPIITPEPKDTQTSTLEDLESKQIALVLSQILSGLIHCPILKSGGLTAPAPRDIAILYPNSTHAHTIEKALRAMNIPCIREEQKGFFERQEIQDLINLIKAFAWNSDIVSFIGALKSPLFGVKDSDILNLLNSEESKKKGFDNRRDLLLGHLADVSSTLLKFLDTSSQDSLSTRLSTFIKDHDVLSKYSIKYGPINGPLAISNILKFIEILREFDAKGIVLPIKILQELDRLHSEDEIGNAASGENAVKLMTIHKSKGLEYPIVVLFDTAEDWFRQERYWIRSTKQNEEGFWYISSKDNRPAQYSQLDDALEENERQQRMEKSRVLYVAMTRAKQHLIVSGSYKPSQKNPELAKNSYYAMLRQSVLNVGGFFDDSGSLIYEAKEIPSLNKATSSVAIPESYHAVGPSFKYSPEASSVGSKDIFILNNKNSDENSSQVLKIDPSSFVPTDFSGPVYGSALHLYLESVIKGILPTVQWLGRKLAVSQPLSLGLSSLEIATLLEKVISDGKKVTDSASWKLLFNDAKEVLSEVKFGVFKTTSDQNYDFSNLRLDLLIKKKDSSWWVIDFKSSVAESLNTPQTLASKHPFSMQLQTYKSAVEQCFKSKSVQTFIFLTRSCELVKFV